MKPQQKKTDAPTSRLRLIAGTWRGRKLPILDSDGLRPTGDRLRETLFNWLMTDIHDARCLDLYAGTGALGFEALSRGAGSVTLVEMHRDVAAQLRQNRITLDAEHAEIVEANVLSWLSTQPPRPYDVVFIDPPFAANLWQKTVDALACQGWLAPDARIYIEAPRDVRLVPPVLWQLHREKPAGAVCAHLFIASGETSGS